VRGKKAATYKQVHPPALAGIPKEPFSQRGKAGKKQNRAVGRRKGRSGRAPKQSQNNDACPKRAKRGSRSRRTSTPRLAAAAVGKGFTTPDCRAPWLCCVFASAPNAAQPSPHQQIHPIPCHRPHQFLNTLLFGSGHLATLSGVQSPDLSPTQRGF